MFLLDSGHYFPINVSFYPRSHAQMIKKCKTKKTNEGKKIGGVRGRRGSENNSQPPLCTPSLSATDLAPGCSVESVQWSLAVNTKDQESAVKVNVKVNVKFPQSV